MKRILFYYPSNKRSNVLETTFKKLLDEGNDVFFLSSCEKGSLHKKLEDFGISSYSNPIDTTNSLLYYYRQILFLINFCKKHQINIVFSHLQHSNFIAVFAQYFIKAKIIVFRHHFKFSKGNFGIPLEVNKTEVLFDKVINRLAKKIVVPSKGVFNGIQKYEKIKLDKLEIIPYLYDFNQYKKPNERKVEELKNKYKAKLRLIMVARLIPFKRHILMFPVFKKLILEGYDICIFILDEGPEENPLKKYVSDNHLEKHLIFTGFTKEFQEYMQASDLLIHPSLTEASNNVVKEIGLLQKAVAVCKGVGDFDDYISHNENGYLMDIVDPRKDAESIIREIYDNPEIINDLGKNLRSDILNSFANNESIFKMYLDLIND